MRARRLQGHRRQVFALMRELLVWRQMTNVKGKDGKALVWAADIAKAFRGFFLGGGGACQTRELPLNSVRIGCRHCPFHQKYVMCCHC